jgi:uncharacterized iron-regulated protein
MKKVFAIILVFIVIVAFKNDKPAYRLYNSNGKSESYSKLLRFTKDADVVFFGELHNNPICHWLQYELTSDLYDSRSGKIVMGAEMFETDNQLILDEYLSGIISNKSFKKEVRLWPNYKTDYSPLIEFAKDSSVYFVATNVPRRYASVVYKKGFEGLDSLSSHSKSYFPPLPIPYDSTLNCYSSMLEGMMGVSTHVSKTLPMAQAIKDATMGFNIAKHTGDGKLFIHYNGSYHSDNYESIIWYLNWYKPGLKIVTIASVEQEDVTILDDEYLNQADFIIVIDESMTKTH